MGCPEDELIASRGSLFTLQTKCRMTYPTPLLKKSRLLTDCQNIAHFFSTRNGGTTVGHAQSLNLGFILEDTTQNVVTNRKLALRQQDMPFENLTLVRQVHGNSVVVVNEVLIGAGHASSPSPAGEADALVTNIADVPLMVLTADCVPILLYDQRNRAIAAIHAGWRGTVAQIMVKTIETMSIEFDTKPEDLIAAIGPSIGPCCYEVGEEVKNEALEWLNNGSRFFHTPNNKSHFDLWKANKTLLLEYGVAEENIEVLQECSKCKSDTYFSSRADKGITGRMGACIMLKKETP